MATDINAHPTQHIAPQLSSACRDADSMTGVKRKRAHGVAATHHQEVPWTAARCNRLLRTITSRISILRKLAKTLPQPQQTIPKALAAQLAESLPSPIIASSYSPDNNDPDWLPQEGKRAPDRTYLHRTKARVVERTIASAPDSSVHSLHTPLVQRFLAQGSEQCVRQLAKTPSHASQPPAHRDAQKRRTLPLLPTNCADKALRALFDAFDALLFTTQGPAPEPRTGTRSLLHTCLSKVPALIAQEQALHPSQDEEIRTNVTSEIYDYLGDFGSGANAGWSGLRHVVRAHAIHLIAGSIGDGILDGDAVDSLVEICKKRHAAKEAQSFLQAWLHCTGECSSTKILHFVHKCSQAGYRAFLFRTLTPALQQGIVKWISLAQNGSLWKEWQELLFTSSNETAMMFLETYTVTSIREASSCASEGGKHRHNGILRTFIIGLTELAWRSREQGSLNGDAKHVHRLAAATSLALERLLDDSEAQREQKACATIIAHPFLMGSIVLQLAGVAADTSMALPDVPALFQLLSGAAYDDSHRHVAGTRPSREAAFICRCAEDFARTDSTSAIDFLRSVVNGLLGRVHDNDCELTASLRHLAAETVMQWTETHDDNASYALAEDFESALNDCKTPSATRAVPAVSGKPVSYRWEEGLCEWVAKTPAARDSGVGLDFESSLGGVDDSGIEMEEEDTREKLVGRASRRLRMEEEEDELALITPAMLRWRAVTLFEPEPESESEPEERDELQTVSKTLRMHAGTLPPSRAVVHFDDEMSDDELGFA
ncbi:hypothetical protein BDY17DRAFT_321346 [Neohortaea acidophila]|uniref:Uncharacterized protein n=1 Tax=Neohortaea acidophila TaxID=245834 RepID=A0A6A6Q3N8_9PEZI|nr:uncharacterized protein BDY17DRAFT_321346 [Neohortaea acidophila]KAF2486566.1 hypothetical protein BDY17DRAFT_321346 [Neohortaea acidophila]